MSFFDDTNKGTEEVQKIKLGDQEFDPTELEGLVAKGRMVDEVETKYNTKIDRVFPEYTKATQKLKEYEPQVEELRTLKEQMAQQASFQGGELTKEQIDTARRQLNAIFGDEIMTKKEFKAQLESEMSQKEIMKSIEGDIKDLLSDVKKDGKPEVTREELLQYMNDTGVTKVSSAYKQLKEDELDDWKFKQLQSGKRLGMHTITNTSAGGKQPVDVRPNKENLEKLLHESLYGSSEE